MNSAELSPVSAAETAVFADLSGDRNPIHVDPLKARRLLYGRTVVHGVHAVLRTLDQTIADGGITDPPGRIRTRFNAPLFHGVPASIEFDAVTSEKQRLHVGADGRELAIIDLEGLQTPAPQPAHFPASRANEIEGPRQLAIDDYSPAHGQIALVLDPGRHARLFPHLSRATAWNELSAVLLGTTYIIGMRCPGMDSLLASFDLVCASADGADSVMDYRVKRHDPRFGIVEIEVRSGRWTGSTTAFVRPAPEEQPGFAAVRDRIADESFAGRHALIVGGSRGLGEVTAKIICAGGGRTTITYKDGRDDAERVRDDIMNGGGRAAILQLDVTNPADAHITTINTQPITDILYFASPHIDANPDNRFDDALYEHYLAFYVEPLAGLLDALADRMADTATLFWPSSTYIDNPARGFAEYAASKETGEAACRALANARPGLTLEIPRLPPLRTDQTSSVVASNTDEPIEILLELLLGSNEKRSNG